MGTNSNSSWEKIQQGVKDVERLICQKEYNASMIKARQTLEFMVKLLAERNGMTDVADLKNQIDALYEARRISKNTCERYHKIRIIGNKAVHEGDANAYNANQAYHMLSQEVYAFADIRPAARGAKPVQAPRRTAGPSTVPQRTSATRSRRRQQQQQTRGLNFTVYDLLKLLVPVLCIVLLFCIVRLIRPGKDDMPTTTAAAVETTTAETTAAETAETSPEPAATYKTTTVLNVRPQPNTDGDILGQLESGASVEYVSTYDDAWAMIKYNGQDAYVASQYLIAE